MCHLLDGWQNFTSNNLDTKALGEIRCYQKSTESLIHKLSSYRLVQETAKDFKTEQHIQSIATGALRETNEIYHNGLSGDTEPCAIQAKCVAIMPKDIHAAFMENLLDNPLRWETFHS